MPFGIGFGEMILAAGAGLGIAGVAKLLKRGGGIEKELGALDRLHKAGTLSDSEYESARKKMIDKLTADGVPVAPPRASGVRTLFSLAVLAGLAWVASRMFLGADATDRIVSTVIEEDLKRETAAKEALLKQKILASPGDFLTTSDEQMIADEPLFGDTTRQLKKMSVTNRTTYPLEGMGGQVQWLSDAGEVRELTTFFLKGSLPGGDTKVFSVKDGTLQSSKTASHAHKLQIKFTSAKFLDIAQ